MKISQNQKRNTRMNKIIVGVILVALGVLGYVAMAKAGSCTTTCQTYGNQRSCYTTCY
jgi:hypothetical protein